MIIIIIIHTWKFNENTDFHAGVGSTVTKVGKSSNYCATAPEVFATLAIFTILKSSEVANCSEIGNKLLGSRETETQ